MSTEKTDQDRAFDEVIRGYKDQDASGALLAERDKDRAARARQRREDRKHQPQSAQPGELLKTVAITGGTAIFVNGHLAINVPVAPGGLAGGLAGENRRIRALTQAADGSWSAHTIAFTGTQVE